MPRFLFSAPHLAIVALIAVVSALCTALAKRSPASVRWTIGVALAANEIVWYAFRYSTEGNRFPEGLPLQLCDVTLWAAVIACLTLRQWAVEFAYFAGLAGAGMAVITPDLWTPWPSYPALYYFAAHGLIIVGMVTILAAGLARPRRGCLVRVFLVTNAYAAAVGVFNWSFGTNYMYLCRKPPSATLLDWLGPWPVYIAVGEAVAFAIFALLWLPWKNKT